MHESDILSFPILGHMSVSDVTSADILRVLSPIWIDKTDIAKKIRQRLRMVFKWSNAQGSCLDGFYMACGSSGNQYKNAPIAGKMMTALVDYVESWHDHDVNSLSFTLPYIQRQIDVGFYSRNRLVNNESSFSVLG